VRDAISNTDVNAIDKAGHQPISPQLAEFFVRDVLNAVETLEAIDKKLGSYDDEDISLFTTTAHAMKTALANVGEIALSALAERLEQAGWRNEAEIISAETSDFISKLKATVFKFTPPDDHIDIENAEDGDFAYLRQQLSVIKQACAVYDKKKAKDTVTDLRQMRWESEISNLLGTIAEELLRGDFDEVDNTIDFIIKKAEL